jgi:hypothetical protein
METLSANRELMDELTNRLIEKETVDGFELNDLILQMTGKPPATAFNPVPVQVKTETPAVPSQ